jgi:hypothetical protein
MALCAVSGGLIVGSNLDISVKVVLVFLTALFFALLTILMDYLEEAEVRARFPGLEKEFKEGKT